jgi:hypothetical protein
MNNAKVGAVKEEIHPLQEEVLVEIQVIAKVDEGIAIDDEVGVLVRASKILLKSGHDCDCRNHNGNNSFGLPYFLDRSPWLRRLCTFRGGFYREVEGQ